MALALASPLGHVSEEIFLAHMSQHLVIADVASLLLVLGVTGPLLQPLLALRLLGWLRRLTHPLVALALWVANLYVWHLPALYQATLTSDAVHALQHACFVGFGVLVWMPLFGPLPKPERFGHLLKFAYILGFRFGGAILGNALIWSGFAIYPDYAPSAAQWELGPLKDQSIGGSIMMIESLVFTVGLVIWLVINWAKQDEERQELLDLASERGVELDERRAGRAVTAGRGAELRQRIVARAEPFR